MQCRILNKGVARVYGLAAVCFYTQNQRPADGSSAFAPGGAQRADEIFQRVLSSFLAVAADRRPSVQVAYAILCSPFGGHEELGRRDITEGEGNVAVACLDMAAFRLPVAAQDRFAKPVGDGVDFRRYPMQFVGGQRQNAAVAPNPDHLGEEGVEVEPVGGLGRQD